MQNEPSYREKGRAVFLAAIMIVSVVAMSAAFAGSAVAYDQSNYSVDIDDDTIDEDATEDRTITVSNEEVDPADEVDVTITVDGATSVDESVTIDHEDSETWNVEFDASGMTDSDTIEWSVALDDGEGSTWESGVQTVTVEEPESGEEESGVGHLYSDDGPTWEDENDVSTVYIGQEITLEDAAFGDTVSAVILYEGPESLDNPDHETSIEATDGTAVFDTSDLETGEAYHFDADGSHFDGEEFWTAEEELDVDFSVNTVPQDDGTEIEVNSDRDYQHLNITSEDFDAGDLDDYIDYGETGTDQLVDSDNEILTLTDVADGAEFEIEFEDVDPGVYEFEFETTDSLAWDNATIEVTDEDTAVNFAEDPVGERGDMIEIVLEPEHTEEGAIQVGDIDEENYQASTGFSLDTPNADEIVILFDTNDPADPWNVPEEYEDEYDLTLVDDQADVGWVDDPEAEDNLVLGVYDYEMTAGTEHDDGANAVAEDSETDTTFLSVTEPETISDVVLERAPADTNFNNADDLAEAQEDDLLSSGDIVADGDELILTLEDFGMSGAVDGASDAHDVFEHAGMNITLEEQDPGPNVAPQVWTTHDDYGTLDDYDGQLVTSTVISDFNEYDGDLVLVIDYDATDLEYGEYELIFEANENSIFVDDADDTIEFETSFELEEPELDLHPNNAEIPNSDSAEVTGMTNIAPGNDVDTGANSPGNFTAAADAVVQNDGTFTAVYDFSEYEAGTPFELDAEADENAYTTRGDAQDDMDAVLVDAEDPLINLNADAPGEVEPGDAAALDVTVSNDGGSGDDVDITVTIDGEDVEDTTVTLDAGEEWSESFDFDTAEEGDINWDVTAGDNSDSGTLTVAEEEEVVDDDDDDTTDDDDDDDDDEDGTPGFGVAVAVVALLAAAMLALRRQD
ncbi:BGTF surface domain-containing protein [Natronobacterium texcoconense]|uniref:PGF-CTERM protein/surface glycoprotein n=1 Tax=Natronobacterium texcoconense TaxID=1095778 RepID=A0A1H1GG31_NATTX|nr:BGTF surface domain-containing protein [Natronobacterium texcoconense]SDR12150.1 PGF-CTERM protein/surface glycoprotein [Natronobacterium texcoconense]